MSFFSDQLEINMNSDFGLNCIQFTFKGKFTEDASIEGTQAWSQIFDDNPHTNYSLFWDCTEMTGFEPAARNEWYKSMKTYKSRITEVTVISKSIIIRGAAKVMLEFFGIKSKVVRSLDSVTVEV